MNLSDVRNLPLFAETYPNAAGYKREGTSQAAAASINAPELRAKVLSYFRLRGAMTADECAQAMRASVLSIRPRVTELSKFGQLRDTGTRRKNASGRSAIVWQVAP